ncbi:MAG: hypothetical protein JSS56_23780, partial [Proteobacteria bacterium]|nr:hypothetical protein [Pseudomonadota bacterium]
MASFPNIPAEPATLLAADQPVAQSDVQALPANLQGRVWHDLNADELQGATEGGIAGATVELIRDKNGDGQITLDEILATTLTDATGDYRFDNLEPGDGYQIRITRPAGYDSTLGSTLSDPLTLQSGSNSGTDIGFFKYATLGDRVWNDTNANGVQDPGESGAGGVRVELYTVVHESVGALGPEGGQALEGDIARAGDLVAVQTTDANGSYSFNGLIPGEYIARFVASDGTVLSTSNVGVNDAADSDADQGTGFTGIYLLASGESNTSVDAGTVPLAPQAGTLSGTIWHDANADELLEPGEQGIGGTTVELLRTVNGTAQVVATTLTAADGTYSFGDLTPGVEFQVRVRTPDGYDASLSSQVSDPIVLQPGENADFGIGFFLFAAVGDRVWNDANANGLQDAGETGRAGVGVEIYTVVHANVPGFGPTGLVDQDVALVGDLVAKQVTDADGNYAFRGLIPGEYIVKFVAPDGSLLSTANVGVNDGIDSDADGTTGFTGVYKLASGEQNITVDAGIKPNAPNLVSDNVTLCEDRSAT